MSVVIGGLFVYPVKSAAGIPLESARLDDCGLQHDREWMIVDEAGRGITQRDEGRLALLRIALDATSLRMGNPQGPGPVIALDHRGERVSAQVWGTHCDAFDAGPEVSGFLSQWLGRPLRMVRFDPAGQWSHRVRVRGVVTCVRSDGTIFLNADPVSLYDIVNIADGPRAVIKAHLDVSRVGFERRIDHHAAELDVAGAVFDESGKVVADISGETSRLKLPLEGFQAFRQQGLLYERAISVAPGRYLVKLVARDAGSGLLGSAAEWVEVPDRETRALTLSSAFLNADQGTPKAGEAPVLQDVQIEKVFKRGQGLHYLVYAYRPEGAAGAPSDVVVQAQVWSGEKLMGVGPTHKVEFGEKDAPPPRVAERIALDPMGPGRYELRLVATDRKTNEKAVRRVGALDDRRELRIADAGHLARRAHRPRPDTHLHDVRAREDQLLGHLAGDDVASHDDEVRVPLANLRDQADKALGVAVGHVDAHVADRRRGAAARRLHHAAELLLVGSGDAHRVERRGLARQRPEEVDQVVGGIVLVQRGRQLEGVERARHLHRADRIHVGRDDRHAVVVELRVAEAELARDVDVRARRQRAPLGADQHVPEVEPDLVLDAHRRSSSQNRRDRNRSARRAIPGGR
jgi:hypothetical protein